MGKEHWSAETAPAVKPGMRLEVRLTNDTEARKVIDVFMAHLPVTSLYLKPRATEAGWLLVVTLEG